MPKWGQCVWVHNNTGLKLDMRAVEGHWVGHNKDSTHAHRIYWSNKNSILVKQNIQFTPTTITIKAMPGHGSIVPSTIHPPSIPQLALPAPLATIKVPPRNVPLPDSDSDEEQGEEGGQDNEEEQQLDPTLPGQYESPTTGKTKVTKSQKSNAPSYTQLTRTSTHKKKPSEYNKQLEAGEDTVDDRTGSSGSRKKKSSATAAITHKSIADFAVDCMFLSNLAPILVTAINDAHGDLGSVKEA